MRNDSMLALLVLVLPFLGYIHLIFTDSDDSIWFFGTELASTFPDISTHIWYLLSKIIPIILLSIWFWNCYKWWRYFIFSPILMNTFTLSNNGFNFQNLVGEWDSVYSVLFSTIIVSIIVSVDIIIYGKKHRRRINRSLHGIFEERDFYKQIQNQYSDIKRRKLQFDEDCYSHKLFHIRALLKQKLAKIETFSSRIIDESHSRTNTYLGLIILLIPVLFYSNQFVPKGLKQITVLGISISDNGFQDINTFYWFLLLKLCIIIPLIIWFLTTEYWWKYAILSPIIVFSYQFWEANLNTTDLDSFGNIKILPLVVFVLIFILMLAKLIRYRTRIIELYNEINQELDQAIYNLALRRDKQLMSLIKEFSIRNGLKDKDKKSMNLKNLFDFKEELILKIDKRS